MLKKQYLKRVLNLGGFPETGAGTGSVLISIGTRAHFPAQRPVILCLLTDCGLHNRDNNDATRILNAKSKFSEADDYIDLSDLIKKGKHLENSAYYVCIIHPALVNFITYLCIMFRTMAMFA